MSDWFALGLEGHSLSGLDNVLRQEESRLLFVTALKKALANPIPHAPDRIALLHDDIKTLDKTLRLRVSMLPLDRPQAWFRATSTLEKSPISAPGLADPIFMPFDESQAALVRLAIPEMWRFKKTGSQRYDPGYSLWGRLLTLNKTWQQLNQLAAPFQDVTLEEMPDAIPDELASPSLTVFGTQISARMKACYRDLEACYTFLWARSESFLYAQHVQFLAKRSRSDKEEKSQSAPPPPPPSRRKASALEEALQFMSFSRLPNFDDLRVRYRAMAGTLHPDRGGCEERFKLLTLHYQALLKQLQRF